MNSILAFLAMCWGAIGSGFDQADTLAKRFILACILITLVVLAGAVALEAIAYVFEGVGGLLTGMRETVSSGVDAVSTGASDAYDTVKELLPGDTAPAAVPNVTDCGDIPCPTG